MKKQDWKTIYDKMEQIKETQAGQLLGGFASVSGDMRLRNGVVNANGNTCHNGCCQAGNCSAGCGVGI